MYVPCVSELDLTYRWPWVSVGDRVNVFNLRQNGTAWARYDLRHMDRHGLIEGRRDAGGAP